MLKKLCNLMGEKLDILSLDQCDELEVQLRKSLELVITRKVTYFVIIYVDYNNFVLNNFISFKYFYFYFYLFLSLGGY
jgi:hypothetical protein